MQSLKGSFSGCLLSRADVSSGTGGVGVWKLNVEGPAVCPQESHCSRRADSCLCFSTFKSLSSSLLDLLASSLCSTTLQHRLQESDAVISQNLH